MRNQPVTIDQELVAFGFAAENRMIVDDQTGFSFTSQLLKDQRRRETADSATHDDAIVNLTCLYYVRGKTFELLIANPMSCLKNRGGVAVGVRVVADASIAIAIIILI